MKLKPTTITVIVMGLMIFGIIFYDLFALFQWGSDATISHVVNVWSYDGGPLAPFLFGVVVGGLLTHFLKWKP